ncbi:MAG: hypothetical protein POH28_07015 [Acidocella sp.]|nr:hypothetical protein [Acidocella sp.]
MDKSERSKRHAKRKIRRLPVNYWRLYKPLGRTDVMMQNNRNTSGVHFRNSAAGSR